MDFFGLKLFSISTSVLVLLAILFLTSCSKNDAKNERLEFQPDRLSALEMKIARLHDSTAALTNMYSACTSTRFISVETSIGALLARCNAAWSEPVALNVKVDIVNPLSVRVIVKNTKLEWLPFESGNRTKGSGFATIESGEVILIEPASTVSYILTIPAKKQETPVTLSISVIAALVEK
jgi:hypothetical protein